MKGLRPVGIAGIGHAVPDWEVDNDFFTSYVETSDEWIQQRTGIVHRRWIRNGERTSDLFLRAGKLALERAGVAPEEVDMLVIGTVSGDYTCPATACLVQDRLGCRKIPAFDVSAACTGFLYALSVGHDAVASGRCRNVLAMGGEALSTICDIYDRNSVVLFGDGAGAVLLQPHEECGQGLIEDLNLGCDGSGYEYIIRRAGGSARRLDAEVLSEGIHQLRMRGREVYRFAVSRMTELISWAMEGQDKQELGLVLPHQMNRRILETATAKLKIPPEKVYINIDRYGNTSAGSVPICLSEAWAEGLLEKDKLIILAAFGAGLTWGGARLRW